MGGMAPHLSRAIRPNLLKGILRVCSSEWVGKGVGSLFILALSPTGVFPDAKEHSRLLFQDRVQKGLRAVLDEHGLHGKDGMSYFGESELDFWVASTLSRTC